MSGVRGRGIPSRPPHARPPPPPAPAGRGRARPGFDPRIPAPGRAAPTAQGRGTMEPGPRLPARRAEVPSVCPSIKAGSGESSQLTASTSEASRRMSDLTLRSDVPSTLSGSGGGPTYFRGKAGKPIKLTANYLKLVLEKGKGVFEYDVNFEPLVDERDQRFRLLNQQRDVVGGVKVFDGNKLFLPIKLDNQVLVSTNTVTGEEHKVKINFKRQKEAGDHDVVQLYNILFGRIMRTLKFTQHNRKYYNASAAHRINEYSLSVWPGYVTAVDQYEGGLLLQLDVSHRVLRQETVRDLLVKITKKGGDVKVEAEKQLLGTSVLTRYNNKSYKIDDIDFKASPKDTFTNEKGEETSYMDYYKRQYGIDIRDKDQPLLINRPKKKAANEGEVEKVICLVPELCLLTGMTDAMRADFRIMKEVAVFTRLNPSKRLEAMKKFVDAVNKNEAARKHLSDWGLHLSDTNLLVEGRVLNPETLYFGRNAQEVVNAKGDWNRAATNNQVLTAMALSKWVVIFTGKNEAQVKEFCQNLQKVCPKMGIPVANPKVVSLPNDRTDAYLKAIKDVINPDVQLVMTIVPAQKADRYAAIKKLCCLEKPVASQVVCLKTISNPKRLSAVAQKVGLQINCKLGGELWACKTPVKGLMVIGIDVYHEKGGRRGSVAGLVASMNDSLSRYYSTVAIQKEGQEIIDALKIAFVESLTKYYETNSAWPQEIVVFRDGVGDGQINVVEKHEVDQFVKTFSMVGGESRFPSGYNPGFTFVVVQKRISTRIFTESRAENPPPGTILDHTATRYSMKDFFLVPQAVNQGTVTPTHLVVVKDSNSLPVDGIQRLSYKLTHMYYNWPGTVRVPAPCQYAHKLVDLIGEHVHSQPNPVLNHKLYYL